MEGNSEGDQRDPFIDSPDVYFSGTVLGAGKRAGDKKDKVPDLEL